MNIDERLAEIEATYTFPGAEAYHARREDVLWLLALVQRQREALRAVQPILEAIDGSSERSVGEIKVYSQPRTASAVNYLPYSAAKALKQVLATLEEPPIHRIGCPILQMADTSSNVETHCTCHVAIMRRALEEEP